MQYRRLSSVPLPCRLCLRHPLLQEALQILIALEPLKALFSVRLGISIIPIFCERELLECFGVRHCTFAQDIVITLSRMPTISLTMNTLSLQVSRVVGMELHRVFEIHTCTDGAWRFEKSGHVIQADRVKCFSSEDFILGPSCKIKIHAQEQEQ